MEEEASAALTRMVDQSHVDARTDELCACLQYGATRPGPDVLAEAEEAEGHEAYSSAKIDNVQ